MPLYSAGLKKSCVVFSIIFEIFDAMSRENPPQWFGRLTTLSPFAKGGEEKLKGTFLPTETSKDLKNKVSTAHQRLVFVLTNIAG